jgi:Tfp pilus assembly protein PilF
VEPRSARLRLSVFGESKAERLSVYIQAPGGAAVVRRGVRNLGKSMRIGRRVFLRLVCLAISLGLLAAAIVWWQHTNRPDYRLRRGQEALHQGNVEKADRLVSSLLADGYADHAHLLRGEAFLRQAATTQNAQERRRRVAAAVNELNQLRVEQEDIRFEAAVIFGLGFVQLKMPLQAEQLLRYVVSKQPDHLDAHRGLAALYFDQGALVLALRHAQEWSRLAPQDGHALRFMGMIYADLGDNNAFAIAAFREALQRELKPSFVDDVKEELAEVLVKQTDYAQALEILDSLDPDRADKEKVVDLRVQCLWGLGRVADLGARLDGALKDYPQSTGLLRMAGQIRLANDDPQGAVVPLERAVELDRHDSASRYLLAQAYETLGKRAEATEQRRLMQQTQDYFSEMSTLSKEAIRNPWDASLRRRLAAVCEKLDKHSEAAIWRKAAAACPATPPSSSKRAGPERAQSAPTQDRRQSIAGSAPPGEG